MSAFDRSDPGKDAHFGGAAPASAGGSAVIKRRILYVEGCRDGSVGGSHISLLRLLSNLDRKRYEATVLYYDDHYVADLVRKLDIAVIVLPREAPSQLASRLPPGRPGSRALSMALLPMQKLFNFAWHFLRPALVHALLLRTGRFDLVHLNNSVNSNHEWMLAARIARVPLVSHERGAGGPLSRSSLWLAGWAKRHICVSTHIRDALVANGLGADRVVVVYNGLDPGEVRVRREAREVRTEFGIPDAVPVIGVVGNVKRWKGQEVVIRATALLAERWPTLRLLLVGLAAPDDPYPEELARLTRELRIEDRVIFTGFQEHPADFMNAMDVVVHSSITPEPFGLVNIEAMYLGKPVVATRLGGPIEIFDNGRNGFLVDPENPRALADQLAALLSDPVLRKRVGEVAHATVMKRFTIAQTLRGVAGVYDEVVR